MTAVEHDAWGYANGYYDWIQVPAVFPASPSVDRWQTTADEGGMMKYRVRMYYDSDGDHDTNLRLTMSGGAECAHSGLGSTTGPEWDVASLAVATETDTYPGDALSQPLNPPDKIIPHYTAVVSAQAAGVDASITYGFEVSAQHDEAYDGLNMELFDYSGGSGGGSITGEDAPASSFILTRMVAQAQNRIAWDSGFMIGIAVSGAAVR